MPTKSNSEYTHPIIATIALPYPAEQYAAIPYSQGRDHRTVYRPSGAPLIPPKDGALSKYIQT